MPKETMSQEFITEFNSEKEESREKEKFESQIFLAFFRHGEKPSEDAEARDVLITSRSKKEAVEISKGFNDRDQESIRQAIAYGGLALRTQETAGLVMGGIEEEITGDEKLAELKNKLDKGLKKGTKLAIKESLHFEFHPDDSLVDKALMEATKKGEWIKFILEKSDNLAINSKDEKGITYTRIAGKIAEVILKYVKVEKTWDKIVKKDRGEKYKPTLERYFGCPAAITAFLAKLIEEKKGIEERNAFASSLDKGHFDYLEGFTVNIINPQGGDPNNPQINLNYQNKDGTYSFQETIDRELLEKLINDRKKFNEEIIKE